MINSKKKKERSNKKKKFLLLSSHLYHSKRKQRFSENVGGLLPLLVTCGRVFVRKPRNSVKLESFLTRVDVPSQRPIPFPLAAIITENSISR